MNVTVRGSPVCHVRLTYDQIDTLAKSMEQLPWTAAVHDQDMMNAYATMRTPPLNTLRHIRDLSADWYHVLNHIPMTPVVVGAN